MLGFWRGYLSSLILTVNPAITYGVFERLKVILPGKMTPYRAFLMGALTKSIATVITYPYILVKTRLQAGKDLSIAQSFKSTWRQQGVKGLYKGLGEQLSKAVLCQAILFALKDYLAQIYRVLYKHG